MTRIVLGLLVLSAACSRAFAAEGGGGWWPFGGSDEAKQSPTPEIPNQPKRVATASASGTASASAPRIAARPATVDPPSGVESDGGWALPKPTMPAIHMPDFSMPTMPGAQLFGNDEEQVRGNRWHDTQPAPPESSAWDTVKGGARRARLRTRSAWDKTVDVLTPGESDRDVPIARREPPKLPFWKRMLGAEEEPEGPRTVTEWMAQDRLKL